MKTVFKVILVIVLVLSSFFGGIVLGDMQGEQRTKEEFKRQYSIDMDYIEPVAPVEEQKTLHFPIDETE